MARITENLSDLRQREAPWYLGPYFILTVILLFCTIAYPMGSDLIGSELLQFAITALLLSALYAVVNHPWLFRGLFVLIIPILLSNWFLDPYDNNPGTRLADGPVDQCGSFRGTDRNFH